MSASRSPPKTDCDGCDEADRLLSRSVEALQQYQATFDGPTPIWLAELLDEIGDRLGV